MIPIASLIKKLDATRKGSSQLDEEIALAIGWVRLEESLHDANNPKYMEPGGSLMYSIRPFTSSLDSAVSLYICIPAEISADPIQVCVDALEQREMIRVYPGIKKFFLYRSLEHRK